jgi:1,2-diacylglycerol 3-alpha-glucosyltransferase
MNILMMTNTYKPIVGGLERSVETFARHLRERGHRVLIVAPEFEDAAEQEDGLLRVPAVRNLTENQYSLPLPLPARIRDQLKHFQPEVIHTHHPFFLGGAGLVLSAELQVPLVFTYHTMYERYTHELPADSAAMKEFVVDYAVRYANLCDAVLAPSESVAAVLRSRGVSTGISVVPTGIDAERFSSGDGQGFRRAHGIPADSFVAGYCGRVSREKNVRVLARGVIDFLSRRPGDEPPDGALRDGSPPVQRDRRFLILGDGPMLEPVRLLFREKGLSERLHAPGFLGGQELIDGYHAMDVFVFASLSETQGLVLAEAMAAALPVVALDGPGVRDILEDGGNGLLVTEASPAQLAEALAWLAALPPQRRKEMVEHALATARRYGVESCVERALEVYRQVCARGRRDRVHDEHRYWDEARRNLAMEVTLVETFFASAARAIGKVAGRRSEFVDRAEP